MSKAGILCVDDEITILDSLREQLLRCFGNRYLVEVAESAAEAMEVMEELHEEGITVLIIVSDWLMPGLKGDEFLIQVHKRFPDIVTVMLTGQAEEAAIQRARQEAELFACLQKPWKESDLKQIISSALAY
ncbi:MAG: response regulator [Cyanobacteria bacterium P01_E01_bin.34]